MSTATVPSAYARFSVMRTKPSGRSEFLMIQAALRGEPEPRAPLGMVRT